MCVSTLSFVEFGEGRIAVRREVRSTEYLVRGSGGGGGVGFAVRIVWRGGNEWRGRHGWRERATWPGGARGVRAGG